MRMVPNSVGGEWPAWSPNGKWIAFTRPLRSGSEPVFRIHPNGRGLRRITSARFPDFSFPNWAPDSRRLVFEGTLGTSERQRIYTADSRTGRIRRLTDGDADPAWSPDGKLIAYAPGNGTGIWLMHPNGHQKRHIAHTHGLDGQPTWAPDSHKIAYLTSVSLNGVAIAVKGIGREGRHVVRRLGGDVDEPSWSPNGRRIAFVAQTSPSGDYSLFVMKPNGSGLRKLTEVLHLG